MSEERLAYLLRADLSDEDYALASLLARTYQRRLDQREENRDITNCSTLLDLCLKAVDLPWWPFMSHFHVETERRRDPAAYAEKVSGKIKQTYDLNH